ncbi:MAG TPA: riboflavin synthase [Chitinophagaceae bacterium]|nr:riboflavin synthase [Chitinophagaceae bacterium]
MFTGIIRARGVVKEVIFNGSNTSFWIESGISESLKIDQSVSHSGACLTIEETRGEQHRVTAIAETLEKTNLGTWKPGRIVNLETSLRLMDPVDGHLVQGHVDTIGICSGIRKNEGSHELEISFPKKFASLVIEKGSIALNGISLTVFAVKKKSFRVAIIPYTFEHTDMNQLSEGDAVNLEFDMIGKYLARRLSLDKD